MHLLECMTQNVFGQQQGVSGHHQTHLCMSEWAIREKKDADNTFELLAIKTYCYFNIFHVRACMKICTYPRKFHWYCLGFTGPSKFWKIQFCD
jgi:hypothetical protein